MLDSTSNDALPDGVPSREALPSELVEASQLGKSPCHCPNNCSEPDPQISGSGASSLANAAGSGELSCDKIFSSIIGANLKKIQARNKS